MGVADFNLKRLNKNNQVPVFESEASLDILNSYASDDFYAILKDGADINLPSSIDSLEIAIGRIPAKTSAEADTMVNKIIQLHQGQIIVESKLDVGTKIIVDFPANVTTLI